jgi:hypothetical protein
MKTNIKFLMIFLISILVSVQASSAWNWDTHKDIANTLYSSSPQHIKANLDLKEMIAGSTYPDVKDKKNKKLHGYPYTVKETQIYLADARHYYKIGNYKKSSFYFGMASHYISDNYCAAHCGIISNKEGYYRLGDHLKPHISYLKFTGVKNMLHTGYLNGKESSKKWNVKHDPAYVQYDLNRAASGCWSIFRISIKGL